MTFKDRYRSYLLQLEGIYGKNEAMVITDRVFKSLVSLNRSDLARNPDQLLTPAIIDRLDAAFDQLMNYRPLQYVLGETWFHHLKIKVNENVLIPRPETEELVERVLKDLSSRPPGQLILDIGTGSGCIPIAIKKHMPSSRISAIDISEPALNLARENARAQETEIFYLQLDFLEESGWHRLPVFDILISNPPYIPESEKAKLDKNVVNHEPHTALFVPEEDPLLFYKKIAAFGKTHLSGNGKIYLETHEHYAKDVCSLFSLTYSSAEILNDMFGKERMVMVTA